MEDDETITRISDHTCQPDFYAYKVAVIKANLKQAVCDDLGPIPQIYERVMLPYKSDPEYDDILPNYESVKDSLYRARKSHLNVHATVFKKLEDVVLSESLNKDFLLCDDGNADKILIFCSTEARETIKNVRHFFADGTFKSVPPPFKQLYTVHGLTTAHITPLIYCLLPNKEQYTYERLFGMIKARIPDMNPEIFQTDYEMAAMNALQITFPTANIKGCFFHYAQALHKKAKQLHLFNNKTIALFVALAHLPATLMPEGFLSIQFEVLSNVEGWNDFVNYFLKQWMDPKLIHAVSCFDNPHRTINAVEGWHSRLNKIIKRKKPNLFPFIKSIKNESIKYDHDIRKSQIHFPKTKKQIKKEKITNDRIKKIVQDFLDQHLEIGVCLRRLSKVRFF